MQVICPRCDERYDSKAMDTLSEENQRLRGQLQNCVHHLELAPVQQTIYDHGGSRVWRDLADGRRELIVDTYTDAEFARATLAFVEQWYRDPP